MALQLVNLPEVEKISPVIIRILGGNPGKYTLQGTNTYLVGSGPKRILIDTGEGRPSWIQALQTVLKTENAAVSKVLVTHWHGDHVGGIKDFRTLYPDVLIHKHQPETGQQNITDGERFSVEGATLRAVHTPGHTQDHMALILEEEDAMFTGDNVLGQGTAVFEDLATYISSLERMRGLFDGRGYPGHGPVIENGRSRILEYIQHRQLREDQVIQVMKSDRSAPDGEDANSWTSMDIVQVIYKDVPKELHVPANGGIVQVLRKLETEEKVSMDNATERWRLKNRSAL